MIEAAQTRRTPYTFLLWVAAVLVMVPGYSSATFDDLFKMVFPSEEPESPLSIHKQKSTTTTTTTTQPSSVDKPMSDTTPWCTYDHLVANPSSITWEVIKTSEGHQQGRKRKKKRWRRRRAQDGIMVEDDEGAATANTCIPVTPVLKEEAQGICRLGRYQDVSQAWSCLRGKHVVFLGDSVMRFQYINMVQALEHGQWDECLPRPRNAWSRDWPGPLGSWNEFFRGVNKRLGGHEVCDCYRGPPAQGIGQVENRYYYNPDKDIRVSFFLWYGLHEHLPQGHYDLQNKPIETITQEALHCEPGECVQPKDWTFTKIIEFLTSPLMVSNVRPDILILNTGLHGPITRAKVGMALAEAAKVAVSQTGGQVFWRTTTTRSRVTETSDDSVTRQAFLDSGLKVLDAAAQTRPIRDWPEGPPLLFYHDKTHYKDTIYSGLNQLALHAMCPND